MGESDSSDAIVVSVHKYDGTEHRRWHARIAETVGPLLILDAVFDEIVDLNVRSTVAACSAGVPHLRRAGGGCIINVTSVAARLGGGPGASLYESTKANVSTFSRALARVLAPDRIRVNAVSPGVILTPFHERYSTPQILESMRASIPMGRLGHAEECAGTFIYLASDALSGYVTGQIVEVNGGQLMP